MSFFFAKNQTLDIPPLDEIDSESIPEIDEDN
jgi:hypothetical protein